MATTTTILRPTPAQLAWQKGGLGVFFHVGVNTFAGKEWSDGTIPAADFAPTDLDADEWVRTAQELGLGRCARFGEELAQQIASVARLLDDPGPTWPEAPVPADGAEAAAQIVSGRLKHSPLR